tara:strand:+ start:6228 stop:8441 length:2214 start_codon:yes stop_codon:yes gene_type:complete
MSDHPQQPKGRTAAMEDDIDLHRLWALLVDAKWLILGTTLLALALGLASTMLATPIYKADGLLQVEQKKGSVLGFSEIGDVLGKEPSSSAEIAIITSRMVLGDVVDQLDSTIQVYPDRAALIGRFGAPAPAAPGAPKPVFAGYRDSETLVRIKRFQVPPALEGRRFTLNADDQGNPVLSLDDAVIASGPAGQPLASEDNSIVLELGDWRPGNEELVLVRQPRLSAINSLRGRLTVADQGKESGILSISLTGPSRERINAELNAISQTYLLQNINRQAAEAEKSLKFLNEQLPEVREKLNKAEEKLNAYRTQADSVDLSMETQSLLGRLVQMDSKLNDLKIKESEVAARFTKEHPSYRTLIDQRRSLEQQKADLNKQINGLPETQQEILRLTRDVQVNQQIYVNLLNRSQELQITKASTVGNVRVIDDAVVLPSPVEPKKGLVIALSAALGLLLSAGYVLAAGLLRRGVETPDQLEEHGIAVYAAIPLSERQQRLDRIVSLMTRRRKRARHEPIPLLAVEDPTDLAVEALRSLRTSLHFATMEASNKVLMISGPSPEVGKSFVTANLAAVLAQVGQKVVVVDADMRKGHLHRYFDSDGHVGLSTWLSGQCELDKAILPTKVEGLHFVPRGQVPPNPSELLMHPRFNQLMEQLSAQYDLVLVDTPPILAVTDAAIIGQSAGTSLLVARYAVNSVKEVDVSVNRFEQNRIDIKGVILNCLERRASNEYGYYAYRYESEKS